MSKFKITAFWQATLVVIAVYLVLDNAFPPLMPKALMIQYMTITVVSVLLYFSFDDKRWAEFKAPINAVLTKDSLRLVRLLFLIAIPSLVAFTVYDAVKPSLDAPLELRQAHPAPPSKMKVFGKSYDMTTLENPVREKMLEQFKSDREKAMLTYTDAVKGGRDVYYQNCYFCHGDLLDGAGHLADAFSPLPANFQDVGTIAQLQESYLFWRIATGGPGLPKEGTPWNSAMPVWHEMLNEDDIWNVITFMYDYVGQVPRIWDLEKSKNVTSLKNEVKKQRANMSGNELYQFRCMVCHGETGMGDGVAADTMSPRPRDFVLGQFKYKTSPGTLPARDQDLFDTIKFGLKHTAMPGWDSILSDAQINSLIPVIKSFDIAATWSPEEAEDEDFDDEGRYLKSDFIQITELEPVDGQEAYTAESLKRGEERFNKACSECHGDLGRGNIISGKRLEDGWGYRIWPRNLTSPWSWRVSNVSEGDSAKDETIRKIYQRLSIGIPGTPMPSHRAVEAGNVDPVSLEDRWHIANYVYSLREKAAPAPGETTVIKAVRVEGSVPSSQDDPAWQQAQPVSLMLAPNIIKGERLFTTLSDAVTVRVLYDDKDIAFLLEMNDRTDSRPGEKVSTQIQDKSLTMYSDAMAIQLPKDDAFMTSPVVVKPLYRHGDSARPTTIWYWNAGSATPEVAANTMLFDAKGPDVKLESRLADNSLSANGIWQHGRWQILMKRPRISGDDVSIEEGRFIPISFANWDGSNGETGSKHTLTTWYWLLLPPQTDLVKVYGLPLGSGLLVFIAGLLLVRSQRSQKS
jgi:DMSO reductase family type II enzyme heme b subunit